MENRFNFKSIFIAIVLIGFTTTASIAVIGSGLNLLNGDLSSQEQSELDNMSSSQYQSIGIYSGETKLISFPRKIETITFSEDSGFSIRTLVGGEWIDMSNNPDDYEVMQGYIVRNFGSEDINIQVKYTAITSADQTLYQKELKAGWNLYAPATKNDYCNAANLGDSLNGTNYSQIIDFSTMGFKKNFSNEVSLNHIYSGETLFFNKESGHPQEFREDGNYTIKNSGDVSDEFIYEGGAYGIFVNNDTLVSGHQNITDNSGRELIKYNNHPVIVFNDNLNTELNISDEVETELLNFDFTSKYNGTDDDGTSSILATLSLIGTVNNAGKITDNFNDIKVKIDGVEKTFSMNSCNMLGDISKCNYGNLYLHLNEPQLITRGHTVNVSVLATPKNNIKFENYNIKLDKGNTLILDDQNLLPYCNDDGFILGTNGYQGRNINIDTTEEEDDILGNLEDLLGDILEAPTAVSGSYNSGTIDLNWDTLSGATKYEIGYTHDQMSELELLLLSTKESLTNNYTFTGTVENATYTLKIRGVDIDGNEGDFSDEVVINTEEEDDILGNLEDLLGDILEAPTGVSGSYNSGTIDLNWDTLSGAVKYELVYRHDKMSELEELLLLSKESIDNNFIFTGALEDTTYIFQVRGLDAESNLGEFSEDFIVNTAEEDILSELLSTPSINTIALNNLEFIYGTNNIELTKFELSADDKSSINFNSLTIDLQTNSVNATNNEITAVHLYHTDSTSTGNLIQSVSGVGIIDGRVIIDGINTIINESEEKDFIVTIDLADNENLVNQSPIEGSINKLGLEDENSNLIYVTQDADKNGELDTNLSYGNTITILGTGELTINYDTDKEYNSNDKIILAGDFNDILSLDVNVINEDIEVGTIEFITNQDLTNVIDTVKLLIIGEGTEGPVGIVTSNKISFNDVNIQAIDNEYILRVTTNNIGDGKIGELMNNAQITGVNFKDISGVDSNDIIEDKTLNFTSANFDIQPVLLIPSVNANLNTGDAELRIITDAGDNDESLIELTSLKFFTPGATETRKYRLVNIDSSGSGVTATVTSGNINFNLSNNVNFNLTNDGTYRITPENMEDGDTATLELQSIDYTIGTDNFTKILENPLDFGSFTY